MTFPGKQLYGHKSAQLYSLNTRDNGNITTKGRHKHIPNALWTGARACAVCTAALLICFHSSCSSHTSGPFVWVLAIPGFTKTLATCLFCLSTRQAGAKTHVRRRTYKSEISLPTSIQTLLVNGWPTMYLKWCLNFTLHSRQLFSWLHRGDSSHRDAARRDTCASKDGNIKPEDSLLHCVDPSPPAELPATPSLGPSAATAVRPVVADPSGGSVASTVHQGAVNSASSPLATPLKPEVVSAVVADPTRGFVATAVNTGEADTGGRSVPSTRKWQTQREVLRP